MTEIRYCYRIIFRDGKHGAWNKDHDTTLKNAEFFEGKVQTKKSVFNVEKEEVTVYIDNRKIEQFHYKKEWW